MPDYNCSVDKRDILKVSQPRSRKGLVFSVQRKGECESTQVFMGISQLGSLKAQISDFLVEPEIYQHVHFSERPKDFPNMILTESERQQAILLVEKITRALT